MTYYRPELAGPPEKFFRVLDKIKDPEEQKIAVSRGIKRLFEAGRHDLVVPFVNALVKRTFNGERLKEEAIEGAFCGGAKGDKQDIVEEYYGHPVITSEKYAGGLSDSWNNGNPHHAFPFLVKQADQGDLDMAKEELEYKAYPEFRQAIDEAFKVAPPAGSRHLCPIERAKFAIDTLGTVYDTTDVWQQDPGKILASYLVGEEEWTKEIERMKMGKSQRALQEGKQERLEVIQVQARLEGGRKKAKRGLKRRQQRKKRSVRRRHQRRR